ncbi:MAG: ribonuclease HII [Kiloniellaceae bacterium]
MPDFTLERELGQGAGRVVIGIDEAGRGPWAGPVTAAAAWLDPQRLDPALARRLDDSKKLTAARRNAIFEILTDPNCDFAVVAVGAADVAEIDRLNILQASLLAMQRAAAAVATAMAATASGRTVEAALIDGNRLPRLSCAARAVVKGDSRSLSIAAASVIAKVTRDRAMAIHAGEFPGYGWERNQGYGTAEHRAGIARLGITPLHRRSFRPIREALQTLP